MKFLWCTLQVKDMGESLHFYQEILGLTLERRFSAGPSDIAFLGDGETKVELICDGSDQWKGEKQGISMGFEVASIDETIETIKEKGLEVESGPFRPNPHVAFFYVRDPNGVKIQFVQNQ